VHARQAIAFVKIDFCFLVVAIDFKNAKKRKREKTERKLDDGW
jgi:hypothetical protein